MQATSHPSHVERDREWKKKIEKKEAETIDTPMTPETNANAMTLRFCRIPGRKVSFKASKMTRERERGKKEIIVMTSLRSAIKFDTNLFLPPWARFRGRNNGRSSTHPHVHRRRPSLRMGTAPRYECENLRGSPNDRALLPRTPGIWFDRTKETRKRKKRERERKGQRGWSRARCAGRTGRKQGSPAGWAGNGRMGGRSVG